MTRFEVRRAFLDQYEVHQVGGCDVLEYWIPATDLADLNANIVGCIMEVADYRGPVADEEFADAESELGRPLPAVWRNYLRGPSWFRQGWLASGAHVWLNPPREMLELRDAWDECTDAHPGIAITSGNGFREQLVLDLRHDPAPVHLVDISSSGWDCAIKQTDDVSQLVDRVEAGAFEFSFGD